MKLSEAQDSCLRIMSAFEGTGYTKLEGNFDGQGWTFGLVGFCLGQGSLQPLIKAMYLEDPALFHKCCTVYVPAYGETMDLAATLLGVSSLGPDAAVKWSLERQKNDRPDGHWKDVFERLGNQQKFKEVQKRFAYKKFDRAISYCLKYGLRSHRALMLFYDCTVQQGSLKEATRNRIASRIKGVTNAQHKMKIIAEEMAEQAAERWEKDVLSRRMCIVNGVGTVHGRRWDLGKEFGLTDEIVVPVPAAIVATVRSLFR